MIFGWLWLIGVARAPVFTEPDEAVEFTAEQINTKYLDCVRAMGNSRLYRKGDKLVAVLMEDSKALAVVPKGMEDQMYTVGTTLNYEQWLRYPPQLPRAIRYRTKPDMTVAEVETWFPPGKPYTLQRLVLRYDDPNVKDQLKPGCLSDIPTQFERSRGIERQDKKTLNLQKVRFNNKLIDYWDYCHSPLHELGISVFKSKFTQYEGCFNLDEEACSDIVLGEPIDNGYAPWGLVTQTAIINSHNLDSKRCVGKTVALNNPTVRAQLLKWFPTIGKGQFLFKPSRLKEEVPMIGLIPNSGLTQNAPLFDHFKTADLNMGFLFFVMIFAILVLAFFTFCVVTVVLKRRTPLKDFPGQEKTRSLEFQGWQNEVA